MKLSMQIFDRIVPYSRKVPKSRQLYLQSLIAEYDKKFTLSYTSRYNKKRNKIGILAHSAACIASVANCFINFPGWHLLDLIFAKINYDFISFMGNINKVKSAGLARFLKTTKKITNENELKYAVSRYFISNGSLLYPFIHPEKISQIAIEGKRIKSKTGTYLRQVFHPRTDVYFLKNLLNYFKKYTY